MWKMYAKSNVEYRNQTYFGAKHLKSLTVFVFLFVFPSGFFFNLDKNLNIITSR